MADIQIQGISKSFGKTRVLEDISFHVNSGHLLSLLGPSGCGKTTLLRIIAGLEYPDAGRVELDGRDLTPVPVEKRNIGIVFQNYALIPHMTVFNNIAYGLKIRKVDKAAIKSKVEEYAALVGLEGMESRKVTQLSGGQQQRVALARALIIEPDILLLDEPLSALDRKIRAEMQYEIRRIQQQVGITTVFVTHDQEEAMTMSDEILLMRKGRIEQMAVPEEIYNHPVSLYASDFLGKANTLRGRLEGNTVAGNGWRFPVLPRDGFAEGQDVFLALRGEQIGISAQPEDGTVPGIIRRIVFTGEICRLAVDIAGTEITVSCINIAAAGFRSGQEVWLRVDPAMAHYYPAEGEASEL